MPSQTISEVIAQRPALAAKPADTLCDIAGQREDYGHLLISDDFLF